MKLILIVGLLLASYSASSETCSSLFKSGTSAYRTALGHNQDAFSAHRDAIREHRRSARRVYVCSDLNLALSSFRAAGAEFENCMEAFEEAATLCNGRRLDRAENNMRACTERMQTAFNNMQIERGNISRFCENKTSDILEDLEL